MRNFEIWMEGYACNGDRGRADKIADIEAETFDEAVEKYMSQFTPEELKQRSGPHRYNRGQFHTEEDYNNRRSNWHIWGCALFDNEHEARRSFS